MGIPTAILGAVPDIRAERGAFAGQRPAAVVRAPCPDTAMAINRAPFASADAMADTCETSELLGLQIAPVSPGTRSRLSCGYFRSPMAG